MPQAAASSKTLISESRRKTAASQLKTRQVPLSSTAVDAFSLNWLRATTNPTGRKSDLGHGKTQLIQ